MRANLAKQQLGPNTTTRAAPSARRREAQQQRLAKETLQEAKKTKNSRRVVLAYCPKTSTPLPPPQVRSAEHPHDGGAHPAVPGGQPLLHRRGRCWKHSCGGPVVKPGVERGNRNEPLVHGGEFRGRWYGLFRMPPGQAASMSAFKHNSLGSIIKKSDSRARSSRGAPLP